MVEVFEKYMTRVSVGVRERIFYVCLSVLRGGGGFSPQTGWTGRLTNQGGWFSPQTGLTGRLTNPAGYSPQTDWTRRLTNQGEVVLTTDRLDRETNKSIQINLC